MSFFKLISSLMGNTSQLPANKPLLPLLFVHVPKTAGTSFRIAAEQSKLVKKVICDYGKGNATNTPELNDAKYQCTEKGSVAKLLSSLDHYILTGHFQSDRYAKYFYPYEICIFLRDPFERVLSNYFHKRRKEQIEDNLELYIKSRGAINQQTKNLGKLEPQYYGFIGISEKYEESISLINRLFNLDLKALSKNLNPDKRSSSYEIPEHIRNKIGELNKRDNESYQLARKIFEFREEFSHHQNNILYGDYKISNQQKVSGRAYRSYSEQAVGLDIYLNDVKIAQVMADSYDPIPCDVKQPRRGNIGFNYSLEKPLGDEDIIKVRASDSDEPLLNLDKRLYL